MKYPLMRNNILREDLDAVIEHLKQEDPILTNGPNVRAFEAEWSQWLGVKYSVFVNSGASANLLAMAILKIRHPQGGEIITMASIGMSDDEFEEFISKLPWCKTAFRVECAD